jgi:hypothetical protein
MKEISLEEMIQRISKEKGGTPEQYNQLMDYISFHETGHKQRNDPKAKQISGNETDGFYEGPGRGLFMFETGEKKGGNSAVNRTVKYLTDNKIHIPKWLYDVSMGSADSKSVDVSKLSGDQQKILFLGNHREHPTSNFSNIWNEKQSIPDFWTKNHWSGTKDVAGHTSDFTKSMLANDSIKAAKIRKEELFTLQDKVPFQSASNNVNSIPDVKSILSGIFGEQKSSLIK